jgi:chromosomal replication initiator protein
LEAAVAAEAGLDVAAIPPQEVTGGTPPTLSRADQERLYDDGLVLNPDYGFEHFVVGPGSRLAHAAALSVGRDPGRTYNPFFVHGDVGLGKTHLLQAICLSIRQTRPGAVIYYTSCEGFMTQFMDAVAVGAMSRFRYKFRHVDVLVIDDIHFLAKRDRTQEEFFHTFNSLYQSHKQIVLSSDAPPEEIPDLEDRLVSRFKWGLVAELSPPCYETRVEILKAKARLRGLDLPDDAACYVAAKIDTNIRELEGAIVKLQMISSVEKIPITEALARAALGDEVAKGEPRVQIQTIITAVTDFFGVKVTDLQSKRRQRSIALPRQVCMYLARRNTRFSLEEIGGYFGGRDHTTVMHAVRTVEGRRDTDPEFAVVVRSLEDKLRVNIA